MPDDPSDADVQREIRAGRAFSLEEAIARLAGPGTMKGASPLAGRREAEAAITACVRRHLPDTAGALAQVLIRIATGSEVLEADPHRPATALAAVVDRHLGNDELLRELVRDADQEWGRMMDERPYFEREGVAAHPDDPYTAASVRAALAALRATLPQNGAEAWP